METLKQKPRVLECQLGARRRYAVPRMLEAAGLLTAVYTDASAHSRLGRWAVRLGSRAPAVVQRLARRVIRGVPAGKIFSTDGLQYREILQRVVGIRRQGIHLFCQRSRLLAARMKRWGLKGADTVYSMNCEHLEFVRWAKSRGARSIVDVYISPLSNDVTNREYETFPDWGGWKEGAQLELENRLWREAAELADLLICPSEWVAEGVVKATPDAAGKIRIVPYGCSIDFDGKTNRPVKGRILFAGGYALRKGVHYLARAATLLDGDLEGLDVRGAGALPDEVTAHPVCRNLNFLGKLNMEQMKQEFLQADVFVLPSLSEGFAGVVAEAIAAGCPVIVTREAGSPIRDGREGLVIPSRDAAALANAIRRMVEDRAFRDACSAACLEQRSFYAEKAWRERLVEAIDSMDQE